MPVMDEFREEREAIKHGTFKQKYQYFKDYYRMPLFITILAVLFVGVLVYRFVTSRDYAFYAAMLNCASNMDNEWLTEEYADYAGIDLGQYNVLLDTTFYYRFNSADESTYTTVQKLEVYSAARQLDAMLGGGYEFAHFANSTLFIDLRQILTEEQIQKYEPYFYYIDASLLEQAAIETTNSTETSDVRQYADPRQPETMENPVPVAIYVENSEKLNSAYDFRNADNGIALGIYANSLHVDNAVALIDYLLSN